MNRFDLVITNGLVVDGSGAEPRVADVAVTNDTIVAVGTGLGSAAKRIVDATNRLVTPGFVDVHTHYDGQATWDAHLQPSSNLGTTTVVMGWTPRTSPMTCAAAGNRYYRLPTACARRSSRARSSSRTAPQPARCPVSCCAVTARNRARHAERCNT